MSLSKESRLLQHTASSFIKTRNSPVAQQTSLVFDSPRKGSPVSFLSGGGTATPPRSNSPSQREESYNKHFRGSAMNMIFTGNAEPLRGRSPVASRAPSMESVDTAASDASRLRTVRRQMGHPNQVSGVTFSKEDRVLQPAPVPSHRCDSRGAIGLWVNSPIASSHNSTGSKKHFESSLNMFKDDAARGRRHTDVPSDLRGTAVRVVADSPAAAPAAEYVTPSRVKPFVRSIPYYCDAETTPPSHAPNVDTPVTGRKRIIAVDHPDITTHSDELCQDRPERRILASVGGKNNDSRKVLNLNEDTTVASPRVTGIRTLDGPPAFVPQVLPQRRSSPNRYIGEGHRSSVAIGESPGPQAPLVLGRGAGLYSPHRQRPSELRLA